jgi:hypothetical protein
MISAFMWLEKALIRGDIKAPVSQMILLNLLNFIG